MTSSTPRVLVDACVLIDCLQPDSPNHLHSQRFVEWLLASNTMMLMPAHGWFEVKCAQKRLAASSSYSLPRAPGGVGAFPIELIHIDETFLQKYGNVDVPYTKAGDHIYLVVAFKNGHVLVSSDVPLLNAATKAGVSAFHPRDFPAPGR